MLKRSDKESETNSKQRRQQKNEISSKIFFNFQFSISSSREDLFLQQPYIKYLMFWMIILFQKFETLFDNLSVCQRRYRYNVHTDVKVRQAKKMY